MVTGDAPVSAQGAAPEQRVVECGDDAIAGRRSMTGRVSAMLSLRPADGSITVTVSAVEPGDRITVDDAVLVVTVWAESPDVIRGRFVDQGSGAVAYFQSSDAAFRSLAEAIHLAGPRPA